MKDMGPGATGRVGVRTDDDWVVRKADGSVMARGLTEEEARALVYGQPPVNNSGPETFVVNPEGG